MTEESDHDNAPLILSEEQRGRSMHTFALVGTDDGSEKLPWEFSDNEQLSEDSVTARITPVEHTRRRPSIRMPDTSRRVLVLKALRSPHGQIDGFQSPIDSRASTSTPVTDFGSKASEQWFDPMQPRGFGSAQRVEEDSDHGLQRPAIATISGIPVTQEFAVPLSWEELEPIEESCIPKLIAKLNGDREAWAQQCSALIDLRRISLHHPNIFNKTVVTPQRKEVLFNQLVMPKVLEMVESARSLVAKNALITVDDIFLFAAEFIQGQIVSDTLTVVMRRATCSSFIAEEAMKCWKQVIITGDTLRIIQTLITVLNKQARTNHGLRTVCLNAAGLFLLRLKQNSLKAVVQHRDFPVSFLKPVLKAASDANLECRTAAAHCVLILFNLVPDIATRFKSQLSDLDPLQVLAKSRKLTRPLLDVYRVSNIAQSYGRCPDNARIDLAFDRLQTIVNNIHQIGKCTINTTELHDDGKRKCPQSYCGNRMQPFADLATIRDLPETPQSRNAHRQSRNTPFNGDRVTMKSRLNLGDKTVTPQDDIRHTTPAKSIDKVLALFGDSNSLPEYATRGNIRYTSASRPRPTPEADERPLESRPRRVPNVGTVGSVNLSRNALLRRW